MLVNPAFFFDVLYPLQDRVLGVISRLDTGLYLSGGTAASRGYLHHRFSDDLDMFVNDDPRFELWADRTVHALSQTASWFCSIDLKDTRFVRLTMTEDDVALKIELINDVPSRVGTVVQHPTLGRLDTAENILANKITAALDRDEPKDLADIWGFCCTKGLSISKAIEGAEGKAAGVFPADLARALYSVRADDWSVVRWIDPPPVEQYIADLRTLAESLILP